MFTMQNTFNEVMQDVNYEQFKLVMGNMMYSEDTVTVLLPESAYSLSLQEISDTVRTPWGTPFQADEVLASVNLTKEVFDASKWEIRGVWSSEKPTLDKSRNGVCLFTPVLPEGEVRPAVIVCPGDAYQAEAMSKEGFGVAEGLVKLGYRPYVLRYLVPSRLPEPQLALMLAILNVRANAEKDGIDPNNLMVLGSSAGGHLCASTLTHIDELKEMALKELDDPALVEAYAKQKAMPDKLVLGNAVVSLDKELGLVMPMTICEESDRDYWSPLNYVTAAMPKTYLWACMDDGMVPYQNMLKMEEALKAAGVPCLCHIFQDGGHGAGLATGSSAEVWMEEMNAFMG